MLSFIVNFGIIQIKQYLDRGKEVDEEPWEYIFFSCLIVLHLMHSKNTRRTALQRQKKSLHTPTPPPHPSPAEVVWQHMEG